MRPVPRGTGHPEWVLTPVSIRLAFAARRVQFDRAPPMRVEGGDPQDDFVGNRFVDDAVDADVVLFGLPYDGAVIGRKGAREGPRAIREQLKKLKSEKPARWRDLGDARMPDDPVAAGEVAREAMKAALATRAFPVALGGDHSLTYGLVRGVVDALGEVSVLNLDAHLDVRVATPPNSGTSFRRLVEDKVVDPRRIAEVGIRPFANSPKYLAWAKEVGIRVVEADNVESGFADALAGLPDPLYVSLDIDVLDETAAPGVSAPTPGGLTTTQLFAMLRALHARRVVAMDVVETAPPLDVDDRTARAAAYAIMTFCASKT